MSLLSGIAMDYLVWWKRTGRDGYGGITWDTPVEICGRWESGDGRVYTEQGEQRELMGFVLTEFANIQRGDMLYKGSLAVLDSGEVVSPETLDGILSVKRVEEVNTLDGEDTHYEIGLGNL